MFYGPARVLCTVKTMPLSLGAHGSSPDAASEPTQSLPLDCLGLAKSAALVRIGDERTALVLTLGASQPDTMLPPGCLLLAGANRPDDVIAGEAVMAEAVCTAGLGDDADGDVRGAAVL